MKTLSAGANTPIAKQNIRLTIDWSPEKIGGSDVDASGFILNASGKVRSDADFIFYNQPNSDDGSVQLSGGGSSQTFAINLNSLSSDISKIAFAVTIHGNANFAQANNLELRVDGELSFKPAISNMKESALVVGELYLRNGVWKFRAVGQGFEGGLGPLATRYGVDVGGEEEEPAAPEPAPSPVKTGKVSLEKKLISLQKSAPKLVSLAKKAQICLKKKNLENHTAAVALMMDVSGSMSNMFSDGTVQTIIERVMGLGLNFDDNGAIDIFAFQSKAYDLGELEPANFQGAASWILSQVRMGGTRYAPAIDIIMEHYGFRKPQNSDSGGGGFFNALFGGAKPKPEIKEEKPLTQLPVKHPIYVLFVTDGDCSDARSATRAIKEAAHFPVFFQFVGIGGASMGYLEELDDMPGRFIDNADFFSVRNPKTISDEALYDKMMTEYPKWLKVAKDKGLIA